MRPTMISETLQRGIAVATLGLALLPAGVAAEGAPALVTERPAEAPVAGDTRWSPELVRSAIEASQRPTAAQQPTAAAPEDAFIGPSSNRLFGKNTLLGRFEDTLVGGLVVGLGQVAWGLGPGFVLNLAESVWDGLSFVLLGEDEAPAKATKVAKRTT